MEQLLWGLDLMVVESTVQSPEKSVLYRGTVPTRQRMVKVSSSRNTCIFN